MKLSHLSMLVASGFLFGCKPADAGEDAETTAVKPKPAAMVFTNAVIYQHQTADTLVIKDGRIAFIGKAETAQKQYPNLSNWQDLEGAFIGLDLLITTIMCLKLMLRLAVIVICRMLKVSVVMKKR